MATFEEIIISYKVDWRSARIFREKFLNDAEDKFKVLEMYCQMDYVNNFSHIGLTGIPHGKIVELFKICLRNDAMRIAINLYLDHMDPSDFNEGMISVLIFSLERSPEFHEYKLFFVHEHFSQFSIE